VSALSVEFGSQNSDFDNFDKCQCQIASLITSILFHPSESSLFPFSFPGEKLALHTVPLYSSAYGCGNSLSFPITINHLSFAFEISFLINHTSNLKSVNHLIF